MRYRQASRNTDIETDLFLELYKKRGDYDGDHVAAWEYC